MDIKKAWNPTVAVPRFEAFACPSRKNRQREAHADISLTSGQTTPDTTYLHPASIYRCYVPDCSNESCEVSKRQNKASINAFNMSATPPFVQNRHPSA
ncbi:MAG: hypothetical protein MJ010_02885 [Paludibacteraceae bacterium]|nr:hypothetical protein [Paludibacteraceae bacterium]